MVGQRTVRHELRTRVKYDSDYVRNASTLLDLRIMSKTVEVVVARDGSC